MRKDEGRNRKNIFLMAVPVGKSKYQERIVGDFYTRNITSRTKIDYFGDWEGVSRLFGKLPKDIQGVVYRAIFSYTKLYLAQVHKTIRRNGPKSKKWPDYSKAYGDYKRLHGPMGYPSFYRFKGNLVRAIIMDTDGRKVVRVTVNKNAPMSNDNAQINASQLMNILEHGSVARGISARPLFGPVWSDMGGYRALRDFVAQKIGKKLSKYSSKL